MSGLDAGRPPEEVDWFMPMVRRARMILWQAMLTGLRGLVLFAAFCWLGVRTFWPPLYRFMEAKTEKMFVVIKFMAAAITLLAPVILIIWVIGTWPTAPLIITIDPNGANPAADLAVSELLAAELRQIRQTHQAAAANSRVPSGIKIVAAPPNDNFFLPWLQPQSEQKQLKVESYAPQYYAGSITVGPVQVSFNKVLYQFHSYCGNNMLICTSMQQCGGLVRLSARTERPRQQLWEATSYRSLAEQGGEALLKELAFKIYTSLSNATPTNSWQYWMHYTTALHAYTEYCRTDDERFIGQCTSNAVRALQENIGSPKARQLVFTMALINQQKNRLAEAAECAALVSKAKLDPSAVRVWVDSLLPQDKAWQAECICRAGIQTAITDDMLHAYRASCLLQLGRVEEARTEYRKAIELKPSQHMHYAMLAKLYLQVGRYDDAVRQCNEAIKVTNTYGYVFCDLGDAYRFLGNYQKAIKQYKKAWDIKETKGLIKLASAYADLGQVNEALVACRKALDFNYDYVPARLVEAQIYRNCGRYGQAIALYKEILKADITNAEAYAGLGIAYRAKGDYEKAIFSFRSAFDLVPKGALLPHDFMAKPGPLQVDLALCFLMQDDLKKAEEALRIAAEYLTLTPSHDEAFLLGLVRWRQGHHDEAQEMWKLALVRVCERDVFRNFSRALYMLLIRDPEGLREMRRSCDANARTTGNARYALQLIELLRQSSVKLAELDEAHAIFKGFVNHQRDSE